MPTVKPWRQHSTSASEPQDGSVEGARRSSSSKQPPWRKTAACDFHLQEVSAKSPSTMSSSMCSTACVTPLSSPLSSPSVETCSSRSYSPTPTSLEGSDDNQTKFQSQPASILSLLQWRWTVDPAEGSESALAAGVVEPTRKAVRERTSTKLQVSDDSWTARQKARRDSKESTNARSDEDVIREVKSILNKLTIEKFDQLANQLAVCGIRTTHHLQVLIQEIFEKATTQHHFTDMYADLCALLNIFYTQNPIANDPGANFKKILLSCCQASFEKHLTPPAGLDTLESEERAVARLRYKLRMLGNIRFVGALLVRRMLVSKVMLSIIEELMQDPTSEALESLAALLDVVGPTFDVPEFPYHVTLNATFRQVEVLSKKQSVDSRTRCLLKDVLDIRAVGWNDRRIKRIDGPCKLEDVAARAAAEDADCKTTRKAATASDWERFHAPRLAILAEVMGEKMPQTLPASDPPHASMSSPQSNQVFDVTAFRSELSKVLAELFISHDVPESLLRVAAEAVPVAHQSREFCELLTRVAEASSAGLRKVGFELIAGLFLASHWASVALTEGLDSFLSTTCVELILDVPSLPTILCAEVLPSMSPLVQGDMLPLELHDRLLTAAWDMM